MKNDFEKLLKKIKVCIEKELKLVNDTIYVNLKNDVDLMNEITQYILMYGGKQLRSVLIILIAKMLNQSNFNQTIYLSSAVELIHMATLMHDDVIDEGNIRHGVETSNAIWGNKNSVLVGDFLFAKSFELMVKCENINVLDTLAKSSSLIAKGEIMQMMFSENFDITVEQYMEIIKYKTAYLFAAATKSSCMLITNDQDKIDCCFNYGLNIGMIFQIIDDFLDYFGQSDITGKKIGKDFYEKKITLPLIILIKKSNCEEKEYLYKAIKENNNQTDINSILKLMEKYNIKNDLKGFIDNYKLDAVNNLKKLENNDYNNFLLSLIEQSDVRIM